MSARQSGQDAPQARRSQKSSSGGGTRTHNLSVNSRARLPVELPRIGLPRKLRGLGDIVRRTIGARQCSEACLNLGMAVRAKQDAVACLGSQLLQRHRHTLGIELVPLERWLEMMKMQCSRVAAVATNSTGPTSLLNKGLLHPPTPLHHRLRATSLAAVIAPSVSAERRLAMPPTHQQHEPGIKLP